MRHLKHARNAIIVAVFGLLLAWNIVSMEKNEYHVTSVESETEHLLTNVQEQEEEIAYRYPVVLEPNVDGIELAIQSENIILISMYENKCGFIKKSGEEITNYDYEYAYPFSEGLACVKKDGKYGYIDVNGEIVLPFIYDDATPFREGMAYFVQDGNYGFMRPDGSVAFYLDCECIGSFQEGLAFFCDDGMYGYMDQNGKTVIEPIYHDACYFENGLATVMLSGYQGIIDKNGNVVVPIKYDKVSVYSSYIMATSGDENKFFDLEGNLISNEEYVARREQETQNNLVSAEMESKYIVEEFDDKFIVYNQEKEEVLSLDCSFAMERRLLAEKGYIVTWMEWYEDGDRAYYESSDKIVILSEEDGTELNEILCKSSITPKKEAYWELLYGAGAELINLDGKMVHAKEFEHWYVENYIKNAKLYRIESFDEPILWCYESAGYSDVSESSFYYLQEDGLRLLLSAERGSGTLRGDYVCLWRDTETGEVLPGISGSAGGFGGYVGYSHVYNWEDNDLIEVFSEEKMRQVMGNYSNTDLEEEPHLFYDDAEEPYNRETIWEAEYATEYVINGKRVPIEEYQNAVHKYTFIRLSN